jgi:hypothetical protein
MTGMKYNLKQKLEIGEGLFRPWNKAGGKKISQWLLSYHYGFVHILLPVISDAMKFVTQRQEQIDALRKSDNMIAEAKEIDEQSSHNDNNNENNKTTNGVF